MRHIDSRRAPREVGGVQKLISVQVNMLMTPNRMSFSVLAANASRAEEWHIQNIGHRFGAPSHPRGFDNNLMDCDDNTMT